MQIFVRIYLKSRRQTEKSVHEVTSYIILHLNTTREKGPFVVNGFNQSLVSLVAF